MDLESEIKRLKAEKNVTILAHYYQTMDVQAVADYIGDSLGLARVSKDKVETPYILFAGVHFMAETASILNQEKTVLISSKKAGCPLATFINPDVIKEHKKSYPNAPVIVYVNTTADTKAHADVCCTSSNAQKIVERAVQEWGTKTVLFGPDKNLAHYVRNQTGLDVITIPENGNCPRHNLFTVEDIQNARKIAPGAKLIVHPESPKEVQAQADFLGSTAGMINYVKTHPNAGGYIVGTEIGLTYHLRHHFPKQKFIPLSEKSVCYNMKKITLENIKECLEAIGTDKEKDFEVRVPLDIAEKASKSINNMMNFS